MSSRSKDGAGIILLIGAVFGSLWTLFKYPIPTIIGFNLITLIFFPDHFGTVFGISFLVVSIFCLVKKSNKHREQKQANQRLIETYGLQAPDKNKPLIGRNAAIIEEFCRGIRKDSWPYYVENRTSDCLREIAKREGQSRLAPAHREWLPIWETRTGIPQEWLDLKTHVLDRFKKRYQEILNLEARQEEKKQEEILNDSQDLVGKFLEIAERKVSIIDDYGDENWGVLPKEIENCIAKITNRDTSVGYDYSLKRFLEKELDIKFREYHRNRGNSKTSEINLSELSGVEFESYVAKVLKENGYDDVRGTSATGDQGADLIAKKGGRTIIIQAKRYQGAVGNKAVQEVIGAVQFYGGSEGWVVTNSTFTASAKALAQKSGIKLIDGTMLENLEQYLN